MRDGRRQRLGLVDGTEGTVQDTYIDRILSDVDVAGEPNILSLDPDANVRTTDQRYLSDAYNYYLGGGYDAAQDDFPIQTDDITDGGGAGIGTGTTTTGGVDTGLTDFEQNLIDQGGGVQAEPGAPISAPGEGMLIQEAIDELADYPVKNVAEFPTGDAELASQIAAEDRAAQALADEQADEQALINLEQARTGQSDLPVETYIGGEKTLEDAGAGIDDMYATDYQGGEPLSFDDKYESIEDIEKANFPYGINPTTGEPYQTPRTIEDQKRVLGVVSQQDTSESLYQKAKNYLGEKTAGAIDWTGTAVRGLINNYVGKPITLLFDALGAMNLPGGPTLQTSKAQSIGLAGENEYQDKYGINTQSQFGDYDQYNIDRVEQLEGIVEDQLSRGLTNTIQMRELKDRQEYNKISGVGGDVEGDQPGMTIAEEIALEDRIDPGLRVGEKEDIDTPADIVDVQAVEEAIERARAMEAAKIAEIDRQNRVREAEEAAAQRVVAEKIAQSPPTGTGGPPSQGGGGGGPPSQGGGSPNVGSRSAPTNVGNPFGWNAGGLIRKRYSKGGIVDLLK